MFNLIIEPKYEICEGAVVCYATVSIAPRTSRHRDNVSGPLPFELSEIENEVCNHQYKGVAVFKDNDNYDIEFGKKIAYNKCICSISNSLCQALEDRCDC